MNLIEQGKVLVSLPQVTESEKPYVASLTKSLRAGIEGWLVANRMDQSSSTLRLEVRAFSLSDDRMNVALGVTGTLKGTRVETEIERDWNRPFDSIFAGSRRTRAIQQVIQQGLHRPDPAIRIPHDTWHSFQSELLYELLHGLEDAAGLEPSSAAERMRLVHRLTLVGPIFLACVFLVIFWKSGKTFDNNPRATDFIRATQYVSVAVASWLFSYLLIFCVGILSMPAAFFQTEAEGIKIRDLAGVQSTGGIRLVAAALALISLAAMGGFLVFVYQP